MNNSYDPPRRLCPGTIFGIASLICALPVLLLATANGRLAYPEVLAPFVIYSVYWSPVMALILSLIAARWNRWWLLVSVACAIFLAHGYWWDMHHPGAGVI